MIRLPPGPFSRRCGSLIPPCSPPIRHAGNPPETCSVPLALLHRSYRGSRFPSHRPPTLIESEPTQRLYGRSHHLTGTPYSLIELLSPPQSCSSAIPHSLLFDGARILDDQTANDLEMEEGDAIEVLLERTFIAYHFVHIFFLTRWCRGWRVLSHIDDESYE